MKRYETILLWSLLTAAFAVVWLVTSSVAALVGAVFLLLLLPVGLLFNLPVRRRMRLSIRLPDSAEKNEPITGGVRLQCGFFHPVGGADVQLCFENRLTSELLTQRVPLTAQGKTYAGTFSVRFAHAGSIRVRARKVRLFDWAGIFSVHADPDVRSYCTVFPELYPVRLPDIASARQTEEIEQYRENMRGTDRTETVWLREYTAGDAIGGIHWKLSSKLDKLIYREPGAPEDRTLLLFWDRSSGTPEVLDALSDAVFSVCQALRDAGIPFTLGYVQDGEAVLQRVTDADTLYRTLPLLLRRDSATGDAAWTETGFGCVLYFTADDPPGLPEEVRVLRCTPDAPQALRTLLQETDG